MSRPSRPRSTIREPLSRAPRTGAIAWGLAFVAAATGPAAAEDAPAARRAAAPLALHRVEPLGLDAERAVRLEIIFRNELERLAGARLPTRAAVQRAVGGDRALRGCTGEPGCLAEIGRRLGVRRIVSGNVGELGDSFVINLKLVDVESGEELRRISEPLRGSADELIEAVRVAAYRLVAPERLLGRIAILSDVAGAEVFLAGRSIGRTPLERPIGRVPVGAHSLRIAAAGYTDFLAEVEVRFQKTTQVAVTMVAAPDDASDPAARAWLEAGAPARTERRWYQSTWGAVAVGAGAVTIGVVVGLLLRGGGEVVRCDRDPGGCGL